jgi:predicted TIM-barrel fold metal-dependent hydrolase
MGSRVSTGELLTQRQESGIDYVIILPFPSTAIASNDINIALLAETSKIKQFIPYYYIREDWNDGLIPDDYRGGKWHWMRGVQDSASNYRVLEDPALPQLIQDLTKIDKPIIFEEDLAFTEMFVEMAPNLPLIIPHLGMLGGSPRDFLKAFRDKDNICFDTALSTKSTILEFLKVIGPERIVFGSDVPFGSMKSEIVKVMDLPIGERERDLILAGNIIRLAKLPF